MIPKKTAVIDVGTNTVRLAVFEIAGDAARIILERNEITRIGEGLRGSGVISSEAIGRTAKAVRSFVEESRSIGVEKFLPVGTQALRAARNADEFTATLSTLGLNIEIVQGDEEGRLSYLGVLSGMKERPEKMLVIDIGGGSTELSFGEGGVWNGARSYPVGAVVLKEEFFLHDPPLGSEIDSLESAIEERMDFDRAMSEGSLLCAGVAGTLSTLAMMDLDLPGFIPEKVHGHVLKRNNLNEIADKLLSMDNAKRRAVPGMEPGRADIIHAGAAVARAVADRLKIDSIYISLNDIRQGIMARELDRMKENGEL
ncbi:MAG TPA: hypothetical protein PLQ76_05575 [bacterium]|nr:hypothetical protein [bacterium]